MAHKKRKTTKRHLKKRDKKSAIKNRLFFTATFLILLFLGFGYYNYFANTKHSPQAKKTDLSDQKSTRELMDKMKKMLEAQSILLKTEKKNRVIAQKTLLKKTTDKKIIEKKREKKEIKQNYLSEIHDYEKSLKYTKIKEKVIKKIANYQGKPKLAIIIDDVSFLYQVKQIKKIPFKITPSFFPPTKIHPDTVKLSHIFKFAMIHLPLEAMGYMHPEPKTLLANSSKKEIEARIDEIKKEFPQIHYYNNHTGSKFTSNPKAMQYLISYMKDKNLHFVDSRTTAATKAGVVSRALHVRLLSRDIFLDNVAKPKEILEQLKKAVKMAKKSGYAIAIGHPHKNTLKTLLGAKRYLKDVQMVYVDEL
ncbi:MAG: divergent polysaccharide deacetylase family protein [Sulfurospirillum sp.]